MATIVEQRTGAFFKVFEIGLRLRDVREAREASIADVMKISNMSRASVNSVESGRGSLQSTVLLAKALNVDVILTAISEDSVEHNFDLIAIGSFIQSERVRKGLTANHLERVVGAGNGALKTTEVSPYSKISGYDRYFDALNLKLRIVLKVEGETFNSKISTTVFAGGTSVGRYMTLGESIGEVLKTTRASLGYSLNMLADISEVGLATPRGIEKGNGSISTVQAVSHAMGKNISLIITDSTGYSLNSPLNMVTEVLDAIRRAQRVSYVAVAKRSGLSIFTVNDFAHSSSSFSSIEKYAKALNLDLKIKVEDYS